MGTIKERKTKGKCVFDAEVRRKGFPCLYRTFDRKTDARIWIQDVETGIRSGRYLPQAEAQGRIRFLADKEREDLLEACQRSNSPNLYPLVVQALSTGMRRSEIRWLTWEQLDLAKGVIILLQTKNKEPRRVPVKGLALTLLRGHARVRRINTDLVIPGERTAKPGQPFSLDNFWYRALKDAEIYDFRFHDLRHSTASGLTAHQT